MIEALVDALLEANAFQTGKFKLASGRMSDFYINIKKASLTHKGIRAISEHLASHLAGRDFDALGGPELGVIPIIGATLNQIGYYPHCHHLKGFIVRKQVKEHGTQKLIEGIDDRAYKVAVVEDVTTSGESMVKAIRILREAGHTPTVAITVVDREEGAKNLLRAEGLELISLVTVSDLSRRLTLKTRDITNNP